MPRRRAARTIPLMFVEICAGRDARRGRAAKAPHTTAIDRAEDQATAMPPRGHIGGRRPRDQGGPERSVLSAQGSCPQASHRLQCAPVWGRHTARHDASRPEPGARQSREAMPDHRHVDARGAAHLNARGSSYADEIEVSAHLDARATSRARAWCGTRRSSTRRLARNGTTSRSAAGRRPCRGRVGTIGDDQDARGHAA